MGINKDKKNDFESTGASLLSMLGSLAIVGLVLLFMVGFSYYLKSKTYHGPVRKAETSSDTDQVEEEYLDYSDSFKPIYIIVKNVPEDGLYANPLPGKKDEKSHLLKDGQVLKAVKYGSFDGKEYYQLDDDFFLEESSDHIITLERYEKRWGYVAITYISSNGVRLRRWPDFQADDNIEKNIFVGSKVDITGKVVTSDHVSAYITDEGLYITTDTQYFKDYTHGREEQKSSEAKTGQDSSESDAAGTTNEDHNKKEEVE